MSQNDIKEKALVDEAKMLLAKKVLAEFARKEGGCGSGLADTETRLAVLRYLDAPLPAIVETKGES